MANTTQTYKTHAKFVPLFHYVALPILLVNILVSAYYAVRAPGLPSVWSLLMGVALFLGALFARVFALAAQDRVIRLEERMRMKELLPADLKGRIPEFTREQIIGLRDMQRLRAAEQVLARLLGVGDLEQRQRFFQGRTRDPFYYFRIGIEVHQSQIAGRFV